MNKKLFLIMLTAVFVTISACGGGGGGGGGGSEAGPATQYTKAVVKLATAPHIGGVAVTLALPAGVTVNSTANPPQTDAGAVVASGMAASNSYVISTYTQASGGSPATVQVSLMNTNGFGVGEFVTIDCNLSGVSPAAGDFTVQSATVDDLNGSSINGVTVSVAIQITGSTTATVKLSTTMNIGGVAVTLALPSGVTVNSTTPPTTDDGVVVASGVAASNSYVISTYTQASGGSPATVQVSLMNTYGFGVGEFVTIDCNLSGVSPTSGDFTVQSPTVDDLNGGSISGVTVNVGVSLQ